MKSFIVGLILVGLTSCAVTPKQEFVREPQQVSGDVGSKEDFSSLKFNANLLLNKEMTLISEEDGSCPERVRAEMTGGSLFIHDAITGKQLTNYSADNLRGQNDSNSSVSTKVKAKSFKIVRKRKDKGILEYSSLKIRNNELTLLEDNNVDLSKVGFGIGNVIVKFECVYKIN